MKKIINNPEKLFVIISIITGLFAISFIPIGAGYDEDTHIARIWEISSGHLTPNSLLKNGAQFPFSFYEYSYRQKPVLERTTITYWRNVFERKIDWSNMIVHRTRSLYFPTSYLVQGLIMGLMGRLFDFSIGWIYLALRLSYLIIYIYLTFLAIRRIPFGKWILFTVAISPMAMIQASSVNPESMMNGIAFLFIALTINYKEKEYFERKDLLLFLFLLFGVATLKPNMIPISILILMIPRQKFKTSLHYYLFIIISMLIIGITNLFWYQYANTTEDVSNISSNSNTIEQLKYVIKDPLDFFVSFIRTIRLNYKNYYLELVGVFGYRYGYFFKYIYFLYPIAIIFAVIYEKGRIQIGKKERILLLITFVIYFGSTFLILYLIGNPVGAKTVDGVQGRYFVILELILILMVAPSKNRDLFKKPTLVIATNAVIIASIIISIFYNYHTECGYALLSNSECYLPRYKNWPHESGEVIRLSKNDSIRQNFIANCDSIEQINIYLDVTKGGVINEEIKVNIDDELGKNLWSGFAYINEGEIDIPFESTIDVIPGSLLAIKLSAINDSSLNIPINKNDEYYSGYLDYNGKIYDEDLSFTYVCKY